MAQTRTPAVAPASVPPQTHLPRLTPNAFSRIRKRLVSVSIAAFLLLVAAYRVFTFVPRPLDGPRTLRPILYALFSRFVHHFQSPQDAQQFWASACMLLLLVPAALALFNYLYGSSATGSFVLLRRILSSRFLFFLSIAVSLALCRLPALLAGEISPDETLFIAAAEKLFRDPIFFRAIDFVTSGPLNVYPWMLPAVFGVSPDYVSTRLIGLLLIVVSIYILYRAFVLLSADALARIAILPAAGAFAVLKQGDFLHCTSEHVSFLLLATALYLCVKIFLEPANSSWRVAGLGMVTAAAFLAKMQAVPILACVIVTAIAYVHRSGCAQRWWRPSAWFAVGLAPLLLLNAIICLAAGVWHDFWMEYIVGVYNYPETHGSVAQELARFATFAVGIPEIGRMLISLLAIFGAYGYYRHWSTREGGQALFVKMAIVSGVIAVAASWLLSMDGTQLGYLLGYAGVFAALVICAVFVLLIQRKPTASTLVQWFGFLAAAVLAGAAVAAAVPHRLYGHYLLLLIFPAAVAMAWTVLAVSLQPGAALREDGAGSPAAPGPLPFLLLFVTVTLAGQLFQWGFPDYMAFASVPASVRAPEGALIDSLTHPDGRITVWGWNGRLFLASGRVSATKDLISYQLFVPNPVVRTYYRTAYLRGLQRYSPELFIDAVDTSHGGSANRQVYGLQIFPEIDSFIQSRYIHVLDAYKERFYIRRDLARSLAGIDDSHKCASQAIRCFQAGATSWIPADLPPVHMPKHALVETVFTPEMKQDLYATVFSNEAGPAVHSGFQFQHLEGDRYRLAVGCGPQWALSKQMLLPQRKPVSLSIEFNGNTVTIVYNGTKLEQMVLPAPMLDSPDNITVGSWRGHTRPFLGNVALFQIRDLTQKQ